MKKYISLAVIYVAVLFSLLANEDKTVIERLNDHGVPTKETVVIFGISNNGCISCYEKPSKLLQEVASLNPSNFIFYYQ